MQIDECRNASDYTVKAAIAKLYRKATASELVPVFKALVEQKPAFEASLDPDYICPSWETPKEEQQKAWQTAWQAVAADAVMCGPSAAIAEFVQRKGYDGQDRSRPRASWSGGPLRHQDRRPGAHRDGEERPGNHRRPPRRPRPPWMRSGAG